MHTQQHCAAWYCLYEYTAKYVTSYTKPRLQHLKSTLPPDSWQVATVTTLCCKQQCLEYSSCVVMVAYLLISTLFALLLASASIVYAFAWSLSYTLFFSSTNCSLLLPHRRPFVFCALLPTPPPSSMGAQATMSWKPRLQAKGREYNQVGCSFLIWI